jgi:hypothetical protein
MGSAALDVTLGYQSRSLETGRGWGSDRQIATVAAGATKTVPLDFNVPAFPGPCTLRLFVRENATKATIWERTTRMEFPFANRQIGPLKSDGHEYPALRMEQHGRLVIYYLDGDAWIAGRIDSIATERWRIYQELAARINPKFDSEIALYLFPDADSKLAYTMHRGMGWATGRILVEIFNQRERIDPYHEVTHIIAGSIGNPPAMLNEGLAAWSQEGHRWDGIAVDSWAKAFAARGVLWPIEKLFGFSEIGTAASRAGIAYPQSASIVGYLVNRFGWEKFLAAYRELKRQSDDAAFTAAFGIGLADVEKDWLKKLAAPEIDPAPQDKVDAVLK